MQSGEWAAWVAVAVSAASAVWSAASARRARQAQKQAEGQAERATAAAEKSAQAEVQSAEAATRSAAALEQSNRVAEERADLAEGVPWRIEYQRGSTYELWNDTDTPKFGITITGEGVLRNKALPKIDGRSCATFMGLDAMGVGDEVVVTWHREEDGSDQGRTWTGSKPSR
jgi:hypothetical protein